MRFSRNNVSKHLKSSLLFACGMLVILSSCSDKVTVDEQSLSTGWQIANSKEVNGDGKSLTTSDINSEKWTSANVPTTVMGALVDAGVYKDIFFADNLDKIPAEPFENPWWFRKEFSIADLDPKSEELRLFIDGINYRANIWLNGTQIASQDTLFGAFRQFEIDVTNVIQPSNILAFEIIPPVARDFYMGFVDWAPTPPDKYMGIYREVRLRRSGKVSLDVPFVKTDVNTSTLSEAKLSVSTELKNHGTAQKKVVVDGKIGDIQFSKTLTIAPGKSEEIRFTPEEFQQLTIQNPKLWWPNGLGEPTMHTLVLQVSENGTVLDKQTVNFGIRTIETYLNDAGVRGYKVNGRDVLQKSGGWVDDLFLRYMPEKDAAQIRYVKEMNMNAIRLEGFWGNSQHLYDLCDQNGILIMVGWSCQWEWPDYLGLELVISEDYDESMSIAESTEMNGVKLTAEEEDLLNNYLGYQVKWLRNHPSIYCWAVGSDAMPKPRLEKMYRQTLEKYDGTRSLLLSAGEFVSEVSGPSGMKMMGPYEYVPPVYWFEDKGSYGGAYGFNSETGPGPQIPPIESIKKMIPEEYLWPPANDMWNYHSGRKDFNSVSVLLKALDNRYGKPRDLEELALKAQLMNYEAMRPMYEAFVVNRDVATGVVQWMLNSPWPEFYWQLYDYYLMPNGAYFGTQKAGQAVTLIYNYDNHQVYVSNDATKGIENYKGLIKIYDINSKVIFNDEQTISLGENEYKSMWVLPELTGSKEVYFLDLKLKDATGKIVADNFYWLSTKKDVMDWDNTLWFYTPQKQYADFTRINTMQQVDIETKKEIVRQGDEWEINVTLKNPSESLAFFIELKAVSKSDGAPILPVFWDENYISLPPGEEKTVNLKFYQKDLGNDQPAIKIQGINLASEMEI